METTDKDRKLPELLTTTTFDLPGFRVVKTIGIVRGITVRTRSLPMTIIGGLRTLIGGRAGIFTTLCETARDEAFQLMINHAFDLGANAIIGVRYDTGPMVGAAEVLCYGTAVVTEKTK
ncbi:MAG: YbjQ family protein [Alphaproteobacteria bacterium]|nr:MAG: YbjQ family protein [Alphaproteobacteria bacterium]